MLQQSGRLTPPLSSNPFIFLPPPPFPLNQHLRHFWFCINLLHSAHSRACVDRWRNRFGSLQMKTTPKTNTYIHTYIHMQPGMPPWLHFHAHFGAITNPTSWLWTCIALLILFYFFFYSAARDAILYLFKRSTRLRMLPKSGHTLCTWCRRALHATFLRLLDSDDLWARRLRIWWSSNSRSSTWHWLPTPFHLPSQSAVASYKDSDTRAFRCEPLNCQNSVPLNAVPPTTLQLQLKGYSKNTGGGAKDREVLLNSVIQKKLAKHYIENIGVQYVKKLHRYYIYIYVIFKVYA